MLKYLRHMAVFSRIVECGSISAAAEDLGLSKSVVSQHLKTLEHELGVSLLNRTTRRQVLTASGEAFYEKCLHINTLSHTAWDEAQQQQRTPRGPITISAPHALIRPVIAPAIGQLLGDYGDIQPTLLAQDQRVDLHNDKVDLAIRVGDMADSGYRQRRLGAFRDILCASPHYIQRKQLSERRLLRRPDFSEGCDYIANAWQKGPIQHTCVHQRNGEKATLTFRANRFADALPAVAGLAEADGGIALVPEPLFQTAAKQGRLVNLLENYHFAPVNVHAIHGFSQQPPRLVQLTIDAIQQQMQQLGLTER